MKEGLGVPLVIEVSKGVVIDTRVADASSWTSRKEMEGDYVVFDLRSTFFLVDAGMGRAQDPWAVRVLIRE